MSESVEPVLPDRAPNEAGAVRFVLRAVWFVVVPALLAVVALRFFVPDRVHAESDGLSQILAQAKEGFAVPLGALVFLVTAFILRHWRAHLPGGNWLLSEPEARRSGARATLIVIATAIVLAFFTQNSLYKSYRILSASMLPSLEQEDLVAVEKWAYGLRLPGLDARLGSANPKRGDVIVFRALPGHEGPPELIKRVVGLPGDVISMRGGHVVINGWEVPTCEAGPYPYLSRDYSAISRVFIEFLEDRVYLATFIPLSEPWEISFRVPAGEVFVLGDNRSSSEDSHAWNRGKGAALPMDRIIGRVDRLLVGTLRNAEPDASQLLKPLDWYDGRPLNLEGVDTSSLRAAITRCLAKRPTNTTPPAPDNSARRVTLLSHAPDHSPW